MGLDTKVSSQRALNGKQLTASFGSRPHSTLHFHPRILGYQVQNQVLIWGSATEKVSRFLPSGAWRKV